MKKIFTLLMVMVVAASTMALPQANLSTKKAKAGFEKAVVNSPLKAKVKENIKKQALAHDFVRPVQAQKAAASLAPAKHAVAEGQTINMPMYFSAGPEYYEEYGDGILH
jgi:hypothetical protein